MTSLFRRVGDHLVFSIPGCTAMDARALLTSRLVQTQGAALMGSLQKRGGIPFVLPDLYLFIFDGLIMCSIGHRSRDTKFWTPAEQPSPRTGREPHSPAAVTACTLSFRSSKRACHVRHVAVSPSTPQHHNEYRDRVAEPTMVFHSYTSTTKKPTVLSTLPLSLTSPRFL